MLLKYLSALELLENWLQNEVKSIPEVKGGMRFYISAAKETVPLIFLFIPDFAFMNSLNPFYLNHSTKPRITDVVNFLIERTLCLSNVFTTILYLSNLLNECVQNSGVWKFTF